jgi:hypothetical protein
MKDTFAYTYTILRYIHDITTGEFVNVGVALHAPNARYASAQCRTTYGRLNKVFPGINGEHFRALMRHIQARFEELGEQLANELPLNEPHNVMEFATSILPRDDSSLQWSPAGSGVTDNPSETLDKLFERMVVSHDEQPPRKHRSDQDVWRNFKRSLEERRLLHHFQPKRISVRDDEVEFKYAWKNGVWHCLEPISFDLSDADNIREKAHQWLGQITSVQGASDHFKLYFLVGQPEQEQLRRAFENAISILNKITVDKQIFLDSQAEQLTDLVAREVASHDAIGKS